MLKLAQHKFVFWLIVFPTFLIYLIFFNKFTFLANADVQKHIHAIEAEPDKNVRRISVEALGHIGPTASEAVPALIDILENDTDEGVRRSAAWAIGNIDPAVEEVIPALIHALVGDRERGVARDPDEGVRGSATWAIGSSGPAARKAVPALINALEEDGDEEVRVSAAWALGNISTAAMEAVPILIDILENDTDEGVRRCAAWAIGNIDPAAGEVIPTLIHALVGDRERGVARDPDNGVRRSAAWALGNINPTAQEAISVLIHVIERDPNEGVRSSAAWALGNINPAAQEVIPVLIHAIERDLDEDVRGSAAWALGNISPADQEVIPTLIHTLERDLDEGVRRSAAWALGNINPAAQEVIPVLINTLLWDVDASVRRSAAQAIDMITPAADEVSPALINVLETDGNIYVRRSVSGTLGKIDPTTDEIILALIIALVKDKDRVVRRNVAWSLGHIGPTASEAVPALIDRLKNDSDKGVRRSAAWALGTIGPAAKAALPALISALKKDRDKDVRDGAAWALEKLAVDLAENIAVDMTEGLKTAQKALLDVHYEKEAKSLGLSIEKLDKIKPQWWELLLKSIQNHPIISLMILLYALWAIVLLLVFWLRPLNLLTLNTVLKKFEFKPEWLGGMAISLRYILLIGFLNDRSRVLDAWIKEHISAVRRQFGEKDTVKDRKIHISIPVEKDQVTIDKLKPKHLRDVFKSPPACLLVWGEGGSGKTSLACKIAKWAMSEESDSRICQHMMIPILIEHELDTDSEQPLADAIKRQLQILTKQAEPIPDELLERLLRQQRILIIVDHLSEMSTSTRAHIKPRKSDFTANALVITSRLEEKEKLGGFNKNVIKPSRISGGVLFEFISDYLRKNNKRDIAKDHGLHYACGRLLKMVGPRGITVLLAKLYVDQMIVTDAQEEHKMPENIPDLMIEYVNTVNQSIEKENRQKDRLVHQAAKPLAWECLKKTLKPGDINIDTAINIITKLGLSKKEAEACLFYLETRLRLIQTEEPAKDRFRYVLDPISEYLAGLYLVELYANNKKTENFWSAFLKDADNKEGSPDEKKSFFLALRDCCIAKKIEFNIPEFLEDELAIRGGLKPEKL